MSGVVVPWEVRGVGGVEPKPEPEVGGEKT